MQLSGANLLIASQQLNKTAGPKPQVEAQFAQALAKETATIPAADEFAPLAFKKTAAPASAEPSQPTQNYSQAAQRPGSQLDIRI